MYEAQSDDNKNLWEELLRACLEMSSHLPWENKIFKHFRALSKMRHSTNDNSLHTHNKVCQGERRIWESNPKLCLERTKKFRVQTLILRGEDEEIRRATLYSARGERRKSESNSKAEEETKKFAKTWTFFELVLNRLVKIFHKVHS